MENEKKIQNEKIYPLEASQAEKQAITHLEVFKKDIYRYIYDYINYLSEEKGLFSCDFYIGENNFGEDVLKRSIQITKDDLLLIANELNVHGYRVTAMENLNKPPKLQVVWTKLQDI